MTQAVPWSRRDWITAGTIAATAVAFCLYRLEARSLWLDEASSLRGASIFEPGRPLPDNGSMVGYYLILKGWVRFAGDSVAALRLPSAIFAAAATVALFYLARRLYGFRPAVFSSALMLVNASLIRYGQEARGYSLAMLLVIAGWILLTVGLETKSVRWFVLHGLVAGFAITVHLFTVFLFAAQAASLFVLGRRAVPWKRLLASPAAASVIALPVLTAALRAGPAQIEWIRPLSSSTLTEVLEFLVGMRNARFMAMGTVRWAAVSALVVCWGVGLVAAGRFVHGHGRGWESWKELLPVIWLVFPMVLVSIFSLTVHSLMVAWYFLGLVPASALLAGKTLAQLAPPALAFAGLALILAVGLTGTVATYGSEDWEWDAVVGMVNDRGQPGDRVAFSPGYQRRGFNYYADRMRWRFRPDTWLDDRGRLLYGDPAPRTWLMVQNPVERSRLLSDLPDPLRKLLASYRVTLVRRLYFVDVYLLEAV